MPIKVPIHKNCCVPFIPPQWVPAPWPLQHTPTGHPCQRALISIIKITSFNLFIYCSFHLSKNTFSSCHEGLCSRVYLIIKRNSISLYTVLSILHKGLFTRYTGIQGAVKSGPPEQRMYTGDEWVYKGSVFKYKGDEWGYTGSVCGIQVMK